MEGRGGGKREEERRGGGEGNHRHLHEKSFPGEEGGRARTWLFPPPPSFREQGRWIQVDGAGSDRMGRRKENAVVGFLGGAAGGENSWKVRELILSHQFYFCSDVGEVFFLPKLAILSMPATSRNKSFRAGVSHVSRWNNPFPLIIRQSDRLMGVNPLIPVSGHPDCVAIKAGNSGQMAAA